jgi:hypothetical protein
MQTAVLPPDSPVGQIPPPQELRVIIARRYAEIAVLKRLLKAAESKSRLCPDQSAEVAHVGR